MKDGSGRMAIEKTSPASIRAGIECEKIGQLFILALAKETVTEPSKPASQHLEARNRVESAKNRYRVKSCGVTAS